MRRVTGMRARIVPRLQMAPGINHPRRVRAARAGAAARGSPPAPPARGGHPGFERPRCAPCPRESGRLGSSAVRHHGGAKRSV